MDQTDTAPNGTGRQMQTIRVILMTLYSFDGVGLAVPCIVCTKEGKKNGMSLQSVKAGCKLGLEI